MTRSVHSPAGVALAVEDQHDAGRIDAVRAAHRRPHVQVTRLTLDQEHALRAELACETYAQSPRGRLDTARACALDLSRTLGDALRGDATEDEVRAAEDDVVAAIEARRAS